MWKKTHWIVVVLGILAPSLGAGELDRPIELKFKENIFSDLQGVDRDMVGVTMGIPLGDHDLRLGPDGRPPLRLSGSGIHAWQFSAFELESPGDPESKILWATLDLVLNSLNAGQTRRGIHLRNGDGASAGPDLLRDLGDRVEVNTGTTRYTFLKNGFTFIHAAESDGKTVISPGVESGIFLRGMDGEVYSSRWGSSQLTVDRNGPACASFRVTGNLRDQEQSEVLCSYVAQFTAYKGSPTLKGRVTLISGHEQNRTDLVFEWAHLGVHLETGGRSENVFQAQATAYQPSIVSRTLDGGDVLRSIQFQTDRTIVGATQGNFFPELVKSDVTRNNRSENRTQQGSKVTLYDYTLDQDQDLSDEEDPSRYPLVQVMRASQQWDTGSITLFNKWSSTRFPTGLEIHANGSAVLKPWPSDSTSRVQGDPIYYAIPWQAKSSKEFAIAVGSGSQPDLEDFGMASHFDVEGRFHRFEDYGTSLYYEERNPAMSVAVQDKIYTRMGLLSGESVADHVPAILWDGNYYTEYKEIGYLHRNRTGGAYNANHQEQNIIAFLRMGKQGRLLQAKSNVEYIRNSHFRSLWPQGCTWDDPPESSSYDYITSSGDADTEHDWWRCVRLWSRLKGDAQLRDEFIDHARTTSGGNSNLIYYRAQVKALEGMGLALSMARRAWPPYGNDPCTGRSLVQDLQTKVQNRLDDWFQRVVDPDDPYDLEGGWVMAPGSLIPTDLGNPWTNGQGWPHWGSTAHFHRGVKQDGCYTCVDESCSSLYSKAIGTRGFQLQIAAQALATCETALPSGAARNELFLRGSQIGFTIMSILHWNHQDGACGTGLIAPWEKNGDYAHIWMPPPCEDGSYDHDGARQVREGDGQLAYAYVGEGLRRVLMQYMARNKHQEIEVTLTKAHEILAAQRFHDAWNQPCDGSTSWNNSAFTVNINDMGHLGFLDMAVRYTLQRNPYLLWETYPAFNPEARLVE